MKNKILAFTIQLFLCCSTHAAAPNNLFLDNVSQAEPKIFVNNRILARVNGEAISTHDLMKKMDISFFREFPQYAASVDARFQYYQMAWKAVLNEMIEKELILADAKESKIAVTSGDIRQEMEESFGPNIIENLNKIGMSYDEAADMIKEEIIIRKMIGGRVHSKALRLVTPAKIRVEYEAFAADPANERSTEWTYRTITVQDPIVENGEAASKKAYELLLSGVSLDDLPGQINDQKLLSKKGKITVSKTIKNFEQELSSDYKQALSSLESGMYSQPIPHKSRTSRTPVYRIFFIEDKIPGGVPSYKEMESKLKNRLQGKVVDVETENYIQKLRQHYHVRQSDIESHIPNDYEPFIFQ